MSAPTTMSSTLGEGASSRYAGTSAKRSTGSGNSAAHSSSSSSVTQGRNSKSDAVPKFHLARASAGSFEYRPSSNSRRHRLLTSNTRGRPVGISTSAMRSEGISHKCISRPLIAFSEDDTSTDFRCSTTLGYISSVKKGIVLSMQSFRDSAFGIFRASTNEPEANERTKDSRKE